MGIQYGNQEVVYMSRIKIGADGKPYDASVKSREALELLRKAVDEMTPTFTQRDALWAALATIGDRLQTCDALEFKLEKK